MRAALETRNSSTHSKFPIPNSKLQGSRGLASCDRYALARDIPGEVAAQKDRERRDVVSRRHATERRSFEKGLPHLVGIHPAHVCLPRDDAIDAIALDRAGRDR